MMIESCQTCRFFNAIDEDDLARDYGYGKCRRYPPVLITGLDDEQHTLITGIAGNETDFFEQPYVDGHDLCGEWMISNVK